MQALCPVNGQPSAHSERLHCMHATHADDGQGPIRHEDTASTTPALASDENVLARLTVDLTPELCFETSDIVLTNRHWAKSLNRM